ncbi:MAG: hypothetical protein V3U43_00775 [Pseudomonadales bacterium]
MEPQRDLWPAIRARAASELQPGRRWPQTRFAVAALVLICVTSAVSFWVGRSGAPFAQSPVSAAHDGVARFGRHFTLGPNYVQARTDLSLTLESELARMAPTTRSIVLANLASIEQGLAQLNLALTGNPNSVMLQQMLLSAYTEELVLLREVNGLARTVRERTEI